jgi:ABC-type histidine transport system ATPase subunit
MALLQVNDLTKRFGGLVACDRVSVEIQEGEIISLIGHAPVIDKILRHLKLWHRPERPPPPPAQRSIQYDEDISGFDEGSQWPDASG